MLLRFQEVAIQIDKHSENIVEVVKNITKDTKKQLLNEQRKILKEIDDHQLNVKAKIKMLEQTSEKLSSDLTTEPSISFFNYKDCNPDASVRESLRTLESYRKYKEQINLKKRGQIILRIKCQPCLRTTFVSPDNMTKTRKINI